MTVVKDHDKRSKETFVFFFALVLAARCGNAEDNGQAFREARPTNGARLTRKSMDKILDSNRSQFFELCI